MINFPQIQWQQSFISLLMGLWFGYGCARFYWDFLDLLQAKAPHVSSFFLGLGAIQSIFLC